MSVTFPTVVAQLPHHRQEWIQEKEKTGLSALEGSRQVGDALIGYWRDSTTDGDDSRHVRRKSQHLLVRRMSSVRSRLSIPALVMMILSGLVALQLFASIHLEEYLSVPLNLLRKSDEVWSSSPSAKTTPGLLCLDCQDVRQSSNAYALSEDFTSTPLHGRDDIRHPYTNAASVKRYLLHHIVLNAVLEKTWMNIESTNAMLVNYFSKPDNLLAYSFSGLKIDLPTTYMYTRTGPGGKLADITKRIRYLSRHSKTLADFQELVEQEGYIDGAPKSARQIIWVVIEDDAQIDPSVTHFLETSGQPYLYFAHGPTRWLGVAQWNAAERAVEVLRDTFFGDGPVFNVDDDAKIEPELLRRVWRVKRAISWPVGNLAARGGWEGAIFKDGVQHEWRLGGLAERVFPIDMNGFAINSSMIGPGRPVSGPWYVSAGDTGAETYFVEKIYSKRSELEGICDNTIEEWCWFAWWNWNEKEELNASPSSLH